MNSEKQSTNLQMTLREVNRVGEGQKNVPKLRFKGYEDAWEQRKLGDITTFNKGKGYSKKDLVESGKPIILYGRLYTDYQTLITKVDTFVKEVENSVISEGWEVIVPASGESAEDISRASVVVESGIILGGDLNIINKSSLLNPLFLALTISNGNQQKEMSKRAQGKSVVHLHNSDLKEINLVFPEIKEQSLIGEYFENLDNLITLHQRKYDALKTMKKTLLSKMFPKDGEDVPEIRFKGFTDAWEQRKLGEISKRVQGNDGRMNLPTLTISAAYGWMDQVDRFSGNIAGTEQKNYTLLKKGELSYNHGNSKLAKYGAVFELSTYEEALVPKVYHSFKMIKGDSRFIEYLFATKLPDRELSKLISSGARMDGLLNITYSDFTTINLTVPSETEQKRVSNCLKELDDLITLHQRKLDELKNMKKTLLQQMFV